MLARKGGERKERATITAGVSGHSVRWNFKVKVVTVAPGTENMPRVTFILKGTLISRMLYCGLLSLISHLQEAPDSKIY